MSENSKIHKRLVEKTSGGALVREINLELEGPNINELQAAFERLWIEEKTKTKKIKEELEE